MNGGAVRLVAVNGGLSEPSSTRMLIDRLAAAAADAFGERGVDADVRVIDLRDLAADLGHSMAVGFASGQARAALDAVESADALVVASPVFNASYSGLFKMFFDLVDVDAMAGKPVLIGATGGSPRHSMVLDHALRPLFSYLRAFVAPTGVYAASEDWAGTEPAGGAGLNGRIDRAAHELAGLVRPRGSSRCETPRPRVDDAPDDVRDRGPDVRQQTIEAAGIANFARLLGSS
ncbi:oxidoreductase [Gordonia rubripertincta]|uniref:FMN reductase n=1 Tax=Gordonia rubripertincta TaxID=36822 RepID=UPI001181075C|nr:FMN reductase [Gordonia rubripertincta]TSD97820.1 oxidoreductase [Gordonia rubripertincta]